LLDDVPVRVFHRHVRAEGVRHGVRERAPILGAVPAARKFAPAELAKTRDVVLPLPAARSEQRYDGCHDASGERDGRPKPKKQTTMKTRATRDFERKRLPVPVKVSAKVPVWAVGMTVSQA
jgi:hypothetical protein